MATTTCVPFNIDAVFAAIQAHDLAWQAFQSAREGRPSEDAEIAMSATLDALLATPCTTQFGALSLLRHLRWWLGEEIDYSADYQPAYALAQARASDIALFLGVDFPSVTPARSRVAPILRALNGAGEAVAGGIVLTGLATLI